jgi:hypothetical protein
MKRLAKVVIVAAALLVLAACSSTPAGGGGTSPTTVQGTVVGLIGSPLANATVTIGSTSDTSDLAGTFSIANVTAPYDATVSSVSGNWAHVYQGLSTATPTLFPIAALGGSVTVASNATVTGTVTTSTTVSSTHPLVVCVEGVSNEVFGCDMLTTPTTPTTTDYSISAGWVSTANVAVRVHALQFARPTSSDLPSSYYGYARTTGSTTLVPGGTYPSNDLTLLGAIGSSTLSGTVSVPTGFTSVQVTLMARLSPTLSIPLGSAVLTGPGYTYSGHVPTFTGATFTLAAISASTAGTTTIETLQWKQGLSAGANRDIALSAGATLASMPASASAGDTFSVTGGGAPLTVAFMPSSSPTAPQLAVTTSRSSVTLPGTLAIPSGSTYRVLTITNPGESLEQAASDWLDGYFSLLLTSGMATHRDGGVTLASDSGATFTVP